MDCKKLFIWVLTQTIHLRIFSFMNTNHHTQLLAHIKSSTGWGELELAKRLNVSQPTVNRILRGQTDCRGSTLKAIERLHAEVESLTQLPA